MPRPLSRPQFRPSLPKITPPRCPVGLGIVITQRRGSKGPETDARDKQRKLQHTKRRCTMNAKRSIKSAALASVMILGGLMATGSREAVAGGPGRGPGVHHGGIRGYGSGYRGPVYRPSWGYRSGGHYGGWYRPYSYGWPYRPFPRPYPYPYPVAYPGGGFPYGLGF